MRILGRVSFIVVIVMPMVTRAEHPMDGESAQTDINGRSPKLTEQTPGLDGFCPVTLIEKKHWQRGDSQYRAVHGDRTYFFAGNEQKEMFLKEPDRYAPVLSGDDLVSFVDSKKREPGKREHGVFYDDRVYLFASEQSLGKFQADPKYYLNKLSPSNDSIKADDSEEPELVVASLLYSKYQQAAYKSFLVMFARRLARPIAPQF